MGKFCTKCGSPVEEGAVCSCQGATPVNNPNPQQYYVPAQGYAPANSNDFIEFCKSMFKFSVDFFKAPSALIKEVARTENFKAGLFFMILQAISISVFIMMMAKKAFGTANSYIDVVKVPYFDIFVKVSLFVAGQCVVLALIFFILGRYVFRGTGSFKAAFGVTGVSSIPLSLIFLLNILIASVFPTLMVYLFLLGIMYTFVLNVIGIMEGMRVDENRNVYLITIAYTAYYFCAYTYFTKIASSQLGSIGGLGDIFGGFMK